MAHLRPANIDPASFEEVDAYARELLGALGIKVESGCWGSVGLDDHRFRPYVDEARRRIESGEAAFDGFCHLFECASDGLDDDAWYELRPENELFGGRWQTAFRAYRAERYLDVARYRLQVVVSDTVRDLARDQGWRGIGFVWMRDEGRYAAKQWFGLVPSTPIGRGLDHPWVVPELAEREAREAKYQHGSRAISRYAMRSDAEIAHPSIREVLKLFELSSSKLTLFPIRSFLNTFEIQQSDFAYGIGFGRASTIYVRGRVARDLVESGLAQRSEFEQVEVFADPPDGYRLFDPGVEFPAFEFFEPVDPESMRDREREHQQMLAEDKPQPPTPSLGSLLAELRRRKRDNPADYQRGISVKQQLRTSIDLPEPWRRVLAVTNGAQLCVDCEVLPHSDLQAWADDVRQEFDASVAQQPIAVDGGGDWYSLVENSDGECGGVALFTHEGGFRRRSWESVAAFLDDMLSSDD